jgi:hypothetical protein
MEEIVKALRKGPGSCQRLERVPHRHLLEGEKEVGARFYRDRMRRDFAMLAVFQKPAKGSFPQPFSPPPVSCPFIAALPVLIVGIAEAFRKIEENRATAPQACR